MSEPIRDNTSGVWDAVIVGAGFTGLAAGLELAKAGRQVAVLEAEGSPGGLAGTFEWSDGVELEKFYHHWFNHDRYVWELVRDLGLEDEIMVAPSRVGMFYNNQHWRLSTPLDLLRFSPLSLPNRIRLGLLVLRARRLRDWKRIEHLTVREWLEPLCGPEVFRVVWEPLIRSKFSVYADEVNAVWFWNKLVLRGGTRDRKGGEQLAYFRGGFGRLAQAMADEIIAHGGEVRYGTPVTAVEAESDRVQGLQTPGGTVRGREYLFTPAFELIGDLFDGAADATWVERLRRVNYLGNVCLVLRLNRSLSETYWLNVNDPGFPFVGVIEHTNFIDPSHYGGDHIVYVSRYLAREDPVWWYSDEAYLDFALEHLQRMFPELRRDWINDYRLWRASYAQPVTERHYSDYLPGTETPFANARIATMAQIYPEDRGTNYAIRDGRRIGREIAAALDARPNAEEPGRRATG